MTLLDLQRALDRIPNVGAVNKARRRAIIQQINSLHIQLMHAIAERKREKACEFLDDMLNSTELLVKKRMEVWQGMRI